jgi:chemotaxis family two-component system response regulator Rcp1
MEMSRDNNMNKDPKVMLVDDNVGEVIIAKAALKRIDIANVELEVFQNPLLAIQHIEDLLTTKEGRESLPNIIFLDLNMPEMNGSEVLRILKEKKALRTIPIIIVTTSSLEEDIVKCYDLHANSVMIKPMDFDDYVHMLEITLKYWLYVYYSVK